MRIAYVIPGTGLGGTEIMLERLVTHLDLPRERQMVFSLRSAGAVGQRLRAAGVLVRDGGRRGPVGRWWALRAALEDWGPDLLHGFLFQGSWYARWAARKLKVPCIAAVRTIEQEKQWHLWLDRGTRGLVTRYTANAEAVQAFLLPRLGLAPDRVTVIPNGLDPAALTVPAGAAAAWRRALGVPADHLLIGTLGRLRHEKGHRLLLEALARLPADLPPWAAVVAGDGPERAALEALGSAPPLAGRVYLPGALPDPLLFLHACDLFVLPSKWEGMPNALMEAMAIGRPCLATAVGGVVELARGETVRLVPPRDPAALADGLAALLRDPAGRDRLGEAAAVAIRERYPISNTAERTLALYRELCPAGLV